MGFLCIVLSGILDVFANLALQKSNGFRDIKWGLLALVLVDGAFLLLSFAVSWYGIKLPIAYTLWGAVGVLGSVAGAYYFFRQSLKPIGYFGIVLVITAVGLLQA
ncbi:SMR family transporter [uncultured Helicobacter sp.]|uniref:SMR family transporter n=1 Tax=uncultured Helicobacter sp. TaxID=175537 RepID=UPI001C3BBB59|nr:ligand-binding protein SH3 [Candidatus Helicobacter avicola]